MTQCDILAKYIFFVYNKINHKHFSIMIIFHCAHSSVGRAAAFKQKVASSNPAGRTFSRLSSAG